MRIASWNLLRKIRSARAGSVNSSGMSLARNKRAVEDDPRREDEHHHQGHEELAEDDLHGLVVEVRGGDDGLEEAEGVAEEPEQRRPQKLAEHRHHRQPEPRADEQLPQHRGGNPARIRQKARASPAARPAAAGIGPSRAPPSGGGASQRVVLDSSGHGGLTRSARAGASGVGPALVAVALRQFEEELFQRLLLGAERLPQLVDRAEKIQPAAIDDPDAVGDLLGHAQRVR